MFNESKEVITVRGIGYELTDESGHYAWVNDWGRTLTIGGRYSWLSAKEARKAATSELSRIVGLTAGR